MYRLSAEDIFEDFSRRFPNMVDQVVEYQEVNDTTILISLSDGCQMKYYGDSGSFRVIKEFDGSREDWSKHFANNLIDMMNYRGMDQTYLSERSGVSQQSISNYMNGKGMPTGYVINKLAKALSCDISDLDNF